MLLSVTTFSILSSLLHFTPSYAAPTKAANVPPPKDGLESNSNYIFLNKDTESLLSLSAAITLTEDLQVSSTGLAFQLNCWAPSPKSSSDLAEQQFGMSFDGTNFGAFIQTSTSTDSKSASTLKALFSDSRTLAADNAATGVIPAGTTFTIDLLNNGKGDVVTDATFGITQGATNTKIGNIDVAETITITGTTAPVVGFTFVIVGLGKGSKGAFTGGKGTVAYSASTSFAPVNTLPEGFLVEEVAETGNAVYGQLSGSEVTALTQTWNVSS